MKSLYKVLLAVILLSAVALTPILNEASDVSGAGTAATIEGYIENTNKTGFSNINNIEITLYFENAANDYTKVATTNQIKVEGTDPDKYNVFRLTDIGELDISKCYLYINMAKYSVDFYQTSVFESNAKMITVGGSQILCYQFRSSFTPTGTFAPGEVYSIGDGSMPGIIMNSAKGTVTGKITTDTTNPASLNGVSITITDPTNDKIVARGMTSDDGRYSIICDTGVYKLTAEMKDYNTVEKDITVYDDKLYNPDMNIQPDIRMEDSAVLFGTDLPHVFMFVGLILSILIIVIVTFHRLRIIGRKTQIIYEDEKDEKGE